MALAAAEDFGGRCRVLAAVPEGRLRGRFAACAEVIAPAPVLPTWRTSPARWGLQFARSCVDAVRLARTIRRHQVDAVVTSSMVMLAPVLAARLAGVPSFAYAREWPTSRAGTAVFWLQRQLATVVVSVSDGVSERFRGPRRARLVQIPDGIAVPAGERRPAQLAAPLRLCVIGSLTGGDAKGQHRAVETLARLGESGIEATLSVVGPVLDKAYEERVRSVARESGVAERVELTGPIDDIPGLLREHDVLLFCSSQGADVTPLVLMEALAEERPVVVADIGSVTDVVPDGECGTAVRAGDPGAMAEALARLAGDPDAARAQAARGRRHIQENFDRRVALGRLWAEIEAA